MWLGFGESIPEETKLIACRRRTPGACWDGERDIIARLVNPIYLKDSRGNYVEMRTPPIPWDFMTLQDAVDFATYAIKTTMDTMRFQLRPKTVGGPIDIWFSSRRWILGEKENVTSRISLRNGMITMDLRDLSSVEKMNVLTEIDQAKSGSPEAVAFLRQCLFAEDYLVRSRCFALLERHWFPPLRESFLKLSRERGSPMAARALAALARSGDDSLCRDLEPLVFQRNKPLLCAALYGSLPPSAGKMLWISWLVFLRSPYRGYLKPSFVADAMALAIGNTEGGETFWKLLL